MTSKRSFKPFLAGAAGVLIALVLGAAWWLGLLTPEPEAVSLASTVETLEAEAEAELGPELGPLVGGLVVDEPSSPSESELHPTPRAAQAMNSTLRIVFVFVFAIARLIPRAES